MNPFLRGLVIAVCGFVGWLVASFLGVMVASAIWGVAYHPLTAVETVFKWTCILGGLAVGLWVGARITRRGPKDV